MDSLCDNLRRMNTHMQQIEQSLHEVTQDLGQKTYREKITQMSDEVVDSNPYRFV